MSLDRQPLFDFERDALPQGGQHALRMTGTGSISHSSTVSADSATYEPQLYYIHTDHLGTPQELTDREGNLQWIGQYRAWGELAKANDSEGNVANIEMPLRFQGQHFDAETRLHYNRFRYYDPQVGRFTTQDPISLAGGLNLYQYAPNPVQWVDLFGLASISPKTINFSQDTINPKFEDNRSINELVYRLKSDPLYVNNVEPVRMRDLPNDVQERLINQGAHKDSVFSLDNRRLYAAESKKYHLDELLQKSLIG